MEFKRGWDPERSGGIERQELQQHTASHPPPKGRDIKIRKMPGDGNTLVYDL
jgi:hypothetical protein